MNPDDIDQLRRQFADAVADAAKAIRPILDSRDALMARTGELLQTYVRAAQNAQAALNGVAGSIKAAVDSIQRIGEVYGPYLREIAKAIDALPPVQREALAVLAQDGWYLDSQLGLPDLLSFAEQFREGDRDGAREALCQHFDGRVETLRGELCERFPGRAEIITAAMLAHQEGKYTLSVPVLLAQADGICVELVGVQLYARREGLPQLAAHLSVDDLPPMLASLLHPLTTPTPISANSKERASLDGVLNRHAVIHGESTDYGTFLNSCRAISLLAYVSWVLKKVPAQTG